MTNNLVKVYSPTGEMFEMTPANARDLIRHVGWKPANPVSVPQGEYPQGNIPAKLPEEAMKVITKKAPGRKKKAQADAAAKLDDDADPVKTMDKLLGDDTDSHTDDDEGE